MSFLVEAWRTRTLLPRTLLPRRATAETAAEPDPADFSGPITAGCLIVAAFFGGLGLWAWLAPLSSAAVAPGTVIVDGKRKLIQHLEGGIVRDILVHDNDRVAAGQVLLRLDDTQPKAKLQLISGRYYGGLARAARLAAEANFRPAIDFPELLTSRRGEPDIAKVMESERTIFKARIEELESQTKILTQRDAQLAEEIRGYEGQIAAAGRQLALIADEIKVVHELLADGLAVRPRLLLLQRQAAEIEGRRSENVANIARARQTMGDTRLRIADLRTNRTNEAVKQLGEVQKELSDLTEQLRAAEDVIRRIELRAPEEGIVQNLTVNTVGGVIAGGVPLMEIVPSLDRLVIEAKVEVNDIDKVRAGTTAQVRLLAYSRRTTPTVDGEVIWISPDRIETDRLRPAYYAARVVVDEAKLAELAGDVHLYPGMPVEVMLVTGSQSMLDYLFAPISRTFGRAFKEK
jgi:HlyD family type I secretion membrane fusion protein